MRGALNAFATVALVALISAFHAKADCYGIPAPSFGQRLQEASKAGQGLPAKNLSAEHARDCHTAKAVIDCGIQQRDAAVMVMNRQTMDGYIAQIIANCAVARARAATPFTPALPGQPQ